MATTSVGTPCYMAPQVLAGEPYGIKCDVWSLGVVFYQTLCGFMPWDIGDGFESLKENITKGCRFPASLKISPDMEKLICSMLRIPENERINIRDVEMVLKQMSSKMELE